LRGGSKASAPPIESNQNKAWRHRFMAQKKITAPTAIATASTMLTFSASSRGAAIDGV
jgi:hypothetical protein